MCVCTCVWGGGGLGAVMDMAGELVLFWITYLDRCMRCFASTANVSALPVVEERKVTECEAGVFVQSLIFCKDCARSTA